MRRLLSLFLVTLLVLRGLLGSAMAMGTAPAPLPSPAPAAMAQAAHGGHGAHQGATVSEAEVPMVASASAHCLGLDTGASASGHHGGETSHGPACSACGICHSTLFHPALPAAPQALPRSVLRPAEPARFASALAAPAIKPPIS